MTGVDQKQDAVLQGRLAQCLLDFSADLLDKPKVNLFDTPNVDAMPPETFFKISKTLEQIMDIFGYDTSRMH